jgi:hypothetical protein
MAVQDLRRSTGMVWVCGQADTMKRGWYRFWDRDSSSLIAPPRLEDRPDAETR